VRTFTFFYLMVRDPKDIRRVVSEHIRHWALHRSDAYRGGPFADRSGGLIVFEAPDLSSAEDIVQSDPFVKEGLLAESWLKEWRPE
jgi:uncharacterized protein YciI